MYGARVVSGKILSVTTEPGDSIENENFSRAPDQCSERCKFLEHTLIVATVLLIDLSFASARIDWNRPGQLCAPGPIHQRR